MNGICPQCKVTPVIKTGKFGVMPRCIGCLDANKIARYSRHNEKRKLGLCLSHNDANGNRYPNNAYTPRIANPEAIERKRVGNIQRVKNRYRKDPEGIKRRRLSVFLAKAGLSLDWYDKQVSKGCGICGNINAGNKGWCIDHNHSCCSYGNRKGCVKCIRGVLCSPCNLAIGMMKDDPIRLRKAADWVIKLEQSTSNESS